MAVAWKKIYTSDDIVPIADGGTNTDTIAQGAVVSNGTALSGVALGVGELLVGVTDGTPTAAAPAATGDIASSGSGAAFQLDIRDDVIQNSMLMVDSVNWLTNMVHTTTDATKATIPFWGSDGTPGIVNGEYREDDLTPTAAGDVLTWQTDGPRWSSAGIASDITIGGENDTDASYGIVFRTAASTLGYDNGTDYNGPNTAAGDLDFSYRPNTHTLVVREVDGNAATATKVYVSDSGSAISDPVPVVFAESYSDGNKNVHHDAGFTYNPSTSTLEVKNLRVSENTTSVNTTNLDIKDSIIRLNQNESPSGADFLDSTAIGSGICISVDGAFPVDSDVTPTADAVLPKIEYSGISDVTSPSGWKVAKSADSTLSANVSAYGVSVMTVNATQTGNDVALSGTQDNNLNIGVGALQFSNGGLYIQTAV